MLLYREGNYIPVPVEFKFYWLDTAQRTASHTPWLSTEQSGETDEIISYSKIQSQVRKYSKGLE